MVSGGSSCLPFSRAAARRCRSRSASTSLGFAVHENIARLDVLVDETALVNLAESSQAMAIAMRKKFPTSMGPSSKPGERHAAGVLQDQHGATAVAHQSRAGPHRPGRLSRSSLKFIFAGEAIEVCRRSGRGGRQRMASTAVPLAAGTETPAAGRARVRHPPIRAPSCYLRQRRIERRVFNCRTRSPSKRFLTS